MKLDPTIVIPLNLFTACVGYIIHPSLYASVCGLTVGLAVTLYAGLKD